MCLPHTGPYAVNREDSNGVGRLDRAAWWRDVHSASESTNAAWGIHS